MDVVRVAGDRLDVGGRRVPLLSGEMHFWRMDPATWESALRVIAEEGIPIVATYLSWRRHLPEPGGPDFAGRHDPRLDVVRFVQLCAAQRLLVHIKPGPWICAEEPGGGYPDWLLADQRLWALDASGAPVRGYNPPFTHPVPAYLHPTYLAHARSWLAAVDAALVPYFYPRGPIVLVQVDNEPSYCFQDTMYGADYHPVTLEIFQRWSLSRYGALASVNAAWDCAWTRDDAIDAPRSAAPDVQPGTGRWRWEHDWIGFKEWLLAEHLRLLRQAHRDAGAHGALFSVNYNTHPVREVPQAPRVLHEAVQGVGGEDLYYVPPLACSHLTLVARAAASARAAGEPLPWAPEIQAGIWVSPGVPREYPDPTPREQAVYYAAAVAFGLKGLNFYMLADRENWALAPLSRSGTPGLMLAAVQQLTRLMREMEALPAMDPVAPVALLLYRSYAFDAYAAGKDDAPRRAAYTMGERVFAALVAAGYLPTLWSGDDETPPAGTRGVVVPAGQYLPQEMQRILVRLAQTGTPVVLVGQVPTEDDTGGPCHVLADAVAATPGAAKRAHLGHVAGASDVVRWLARVSIRPPVACDHPDALAVLHRGGNHVRVFVLWCGTIPTTVTLRFADIAQGMLRPLGSPGPTVPVTAGQATCHLEPVSATVYDVVPTSQKELP